MFSSKIRPWMILIPLAALLLAACAPAIPSGVLPAPTNVPAENGAAMPAVATLAPDATAASSSGAAPAGGLKFVLVPDQSEASYSVREQLANRDLPNDAVGKTTAVSGEMVLKADGSVDPSSKFVVDVSTLKTDSSMRDGYVKGRILGADQYPNVTFVPTQVSGLPNPLPTSGDVSFKMTGDLTVRDVTKPVTWDVTGKIVNGVATGTATTSFTFGEFNLNQPKVPVVLSVVDKITLTLNGAIQMPTP